MKISTANEKISLEKAIVIKNANQHKSKSKISNNFIFNNENFSFSTRTEFEQTQTESYNNPTTAYSDAQHRSSLPVTINLNQENNSQRGNLPGSITIPLGNSRSIVNRFVDFHLLFSDSQVTREGDKISVNIDLRLVDLQNLKQQQNREHPDWSGLDPLDRHIRKLEQSLDQVRFELLVQFCFFVHESYR